MVEVKVKDSPFNKSSVLSDAEKESLRKVNKQKARGIVEPEETKKKEKPTKKKETKKKSKVKEKEKATESPEIPDDTE